MSPVTSSSFMRGDLTDLHFKFQDSLGRMTLLFTHLPILCIPDALQVPVDSVRSLDIR